MTSVRKGWNIIHSVFIGLRGNENPYSILTYVLKESTKDEIFKFISAMLNKELIGSEDELLEF